MKFVIPILLLLLGACQPICSSFPEWTEWGYQVDVEHTSTGQVATGATKTIGEILEVGIDPACYVGSQFGIVKK